MVSSPSSECEAVKSACSDDESALAMILMIRFHFFFASVMTDLSTSFGRTLLASRCCHIGDCS